MLNVNIREIKRRDRENSGIFISNVRFRLEPGFIYTITGLNGSGKTTLLKSLTSLHDQRFFSIEGEVFYKNINLLTTDNNQLAELRKNKIKYVFQDPGSSFNPLKKIDYYFRLFNTDKERVDELLDYFQLPGCIF
jgi:ABC-type glutathione transport system ATPase component